MKLTYVIQISKNVFLMKNGLYNINILHTDLYKFSNILWLIGESFLKLIVTFLYCTKYNVINMFHSVVQKKKVSYTESHKMFLIYEGLCLETTGYVF